MNGVEILHGPRQPRPTANPWRIDFRVGFTQLQYRIYTPENERMSPQKGTCLKGNYIFQPSFFRSLIMLVSVRVKAFETLAVLKVVSFHTFCLQVNHLKSSAYELQKLGTCPTSHSFCKQRILPFPNPITLSKDDWGLQSPPKRKVFRFHETVLRLGDGIPRVWWKNKVSNVPAGKKTCLPSV